MNEITNIAKANNLLVIEDSAQSVGAELDGGKREVLAMLQALAFTL